MKIEVTTEQFCTIKLALIGWGVRCENEAKTMDRFASEYEAEGDTATADKARRNAEASRRLKADAETLLAVLR